MASPELPSEDSYGRVKRLLFVRSVVDSIHPGRILDIGCGTGATLTLPLAQAAPDSTVIGADDDTQSIAFAQQHCVAPNLRFIPAAELDGSHTFDLIVASEVLEHVEDPPAFLAALKARLADGGRLIVTVPNGFGPAEWVALLEVALNLSGLQAVLRPIKRAITGCPPQTSVDTLAVSPHVNFFTRSELSLLFRRTGLRVVQFSPRTFLCGYLLDGLIKSPRITSWNALIANRLPPWMASDWMYELEAAASMPGVAWQRGAWSRVRRRLNLRRWKLSPR